MYRVLALLVCAALLSGSGPLSGLHVHEYATHDHGEHHHGPAAHSHEAEAADHHEDADDAPAGLHVESCDAGVHAVAFAFTCVTPNVQHVALTGDLAFATAVRPPPVRPRLLRLSDLRAHSPPRLTDAPLRAPPLVDPA